MGVVWRARDELLSRDVAVKELVWPAYFSEAEQQAVCHCASREGMLAARLSHRNVIRVFDSFEEDGRPWLVMELLRCGSLGDLIKAEGPLSPVQAARIGLEVLAALRAAHAAGVVHRDVKPANILVGPDRVVLTDFGIARPTSRPAATTAGLLVGSPSYTAPERAMGRPSGPAGDLWGLGASLYAAVEGHGPFDRDAGALASLTAVVADEPPPTAHAGPLLSPVISGLLRKNPDERLEAAEAERLLSRAAGLTAIPRHGPRPRPRRVRGSTALAGSATLAALAVSGAVVGFALTSSPHVGPAAAAVAPAATGSTPARAAGTPIAAPTRTSPAARAPRAQAPHPSSTASTTANTTASLRTEDAGPGATRHGRLAGRPGRFIVPLPPPGRHADRGQGGGHHQGGPHQGGPHQGGGPGHGGWHPAQPPGRPGGTIDGEQPVTVSNPERGARIPGRSR